MRFLPLFVLIFSLASHADVVISDSNDQHTAWTGLTVAEKGFPGSETVLRTEAAIAGKSKRKPFTRTQKETVKQQNAEENDGKNRCENCDTETIPAKKHVRGVTPPLNEAHVDHVIPQAQGGKSETDNGQVLCRDCNIKKGDKLPALEPEK